MSSEISDLCEISDLLLFFSYFASQNKDIMAGNSFFDVCCVNQNILVRCQVDFDLVLDYSTTTEMSNSYLFVPIAMNMKGDVASNWKFFKDQWQNCEVPSGLAQKEANVRLATLTVVMGKDCYEILQRLLDSESKTTVEETLTAIEQYFIPKRNVT